MSATTTDTPWMTRKQAAQYLGVSTVYLGLLERKGRAPRHKVLPQARGKGERRSKVLYRREWLDQWVEKQG